MIGLVVGPDHCLGLWGIEPRARALEDSRLRSRACRRRTAWRFGRGRQPTTPLRENAVVHHSKIDRRMAELGQERRIGAACNISALSPRADVGADIVEPPLSAISGLMRSKLAPVSAAFLEIFG
jgi:hypothetical protein